MTIKSGGESSTKANGSATRLAANTTPTTKKPKRTPEQQAVLDQVAAASGKDYADAHAEQIISQAEVYGFC